MNPLSPVTYYRRHVKSALLFLAFISLMTLGVGVMVRLVDSIWEELYNAQRYVARLSLVSAAGPTLDAGVVAQIRAHPGVAQVILKHGDKAISLGYISSGDLVGEMVPSPVTVITTCTVLAIAIDRKQMLQLPEVAQAEIKKRFARAQKALQEVIAGS